MRAARSCLPCASQVAGTTPPPLPPPLFVRYDAGIVTIKGRSCTVVAKKPIYKDTTSGAEARKGRGRGDPRACGWRVRSPSLPSVQQTVLSLPL